MDETFRYDGGAGSFGTEIAEDSAFTRVGLLVKKENMGSGVYYVYERGSFSTRRARPAASPLRRHSVFLWSRPPASVSKARKMN